MSDRTTGPGKAPAGPTSPTDEGIGMNTLVLARDHKKAATAVLARARSDGAFRHRLFARPRAVLAEAGVVVPADVDLR